MFYLALCYDRGNGVVKNMAHMKKFYESAAERNHALALNNLGSKYYSGNQGILLNYTNAFKYFSMALERNVLMAYNNVGLCYLYGRGVEKDLVKAARLLRVSLQHGQIVSKKHMVIAIKEYTKNIDSIPIQDEPVVSWSGKITTENGDDCMVAFERFKYGIGVRCDQKEAKNRLFDALLYKHQVAFAIYSLEGTEKKPQGIAHAISILERCKNNLHGAFHLAQCYASGNGVSINPQESFRLASSAASRGHVAALHLVGEAFERGFGVTKDLNEALKAYQHAADLGNGKALLKLGAMYRDGIGVDRNIEKTIALFRSAAELGHTEAEELAEATESYENELLSTVAKLESSGTLDLSAADGLLYSDVLLRVDASKIKRVVISNSLMNELPPSFYRSNEVAALGISDSSIQFRDSLNSLKLERLVIRGLRAIVMALLFA
jgi:TPR repeat protein